MALKIGARHLYIFSQMGELLTRYDKIYVSHNEQNHLYSRGKQLLQTIEIDDFTIGFAICIEAVFPHHFERWANRNVDLMLFASISIDSRQKRLLVGHATAFNYWIAASQAATTENECSTMIIEPDGTIAAISTATSSSEIIYLELDKSAEHLATALKLARPWRASVRAKISN